MLVNVFREIRQYPRVDKFGVIVGGALGAVMILVVSMIFLAPPTSIAVLPPGPAAGGQADAPAVRTVQLSLVEIFENTEAGTVRVEVQRDGPMEEPTGVGSGFVFDMEGHIITNSHVVDDASKIIVTFLDGRSYNADLIGDDPYTDIAVLRVDADRDLLYPIPLGDSSRLKVGEDIAAIGNPFGLSGSMTSGIVSQLGRLLPAHNGLFQIPDVIQTDAAINPGNSGGPLLNMMGEIIGINTAIQSDTGEFAGVGFAIPSKTLEKIVPSLITHGEYSHPWIGISGRDIDPDLARILDLDDARGFLVTRVVEDSPAHAAGMRGFDRIVDVDGASYHVGGDIIVSVDGIDVRKIDDILIHLQRQKSVGDEMSITVMRDGNLTTLTLVLEQRPDF